MWDGKIVEEFPGDPQGKPVLIDVQFNTHLSLGRTKLVTMGDLHDCRELDRREQNGSLPGNGGLHHLGLENAIFGTVYSKEPVRIQSGRSLERPE